eukprot:5512750-Amphidinium_carterae.1
MLGRNCTRVCQINWQLLLPKHHNGFKIENTKHARPVYSPSQGDHRLLLRKKTFVTSSRVVVLVIVARWQRTWQPTTLTKEGTFSTGTPVHFETTAATSSCRATSSPAPLWLGIILVGLPSEQWSCV